MRKLSSAVIISNAESYIGLPGEIFYDLSGVMRISDGVTVGGIILIPQGIAPIITITDDYLVNSNDFTILADTNNSNISITLNTNETYTGKIFVVKNIGNNWAIVNTTDGTIDGNIEVNIPIINNSYVFQYDGMNFQILASNQPTSGIILTDISTGNDYRLQISDGVLQTEKLN